MRTYKRMAAVTLLVLATIFCIAQLSPKKTASICNKCQEEAASVGGDTEDFSFVNLITLKFM